MGRAAVTDAVERALLDGLTDAFLAANPHITRSRALFLAASWLNDGARLTGMTRGEYAAWMQSQTEGDPELEAHWQAIVDDASVRHQP